MSRRALGPWPWVGLLLVLGLLWWYARAPDEPLRRSRVQMGTVVEIVAQGAEAQALETAMSAAFREIDRVETRFSAHREESDVALLSRPASMFEVSAETAAVLAQALEVSARSQGAFDPALGRLKRLWALEGEAPRVPRREELATALSLAGPGALQLRGRQVVKRHPGVQVDLGGIAKGYAVDRAAAKLAAASPKWGIVDAGGDMRLVGVPSGRPWRVGIQHPRQPGRLLAVLSWPAPAAIVTSGDYERAVTIAGESYHHLFDPRTGYPARACQSVTVVAATAMLADALATAAFVLGPVEGLELLEQWEGVEGLLVAADGSTHTTSGIGDRLEWR